MTTEETLRSIADWKGELHTDFIHETLQAHGLEVGEYRTWLRDQQTGWDNFWGVEALIEFLGY